MTSARSRLRLAVLASGEGTTLQAIADACAAGVLSAEIVAVVGNNREVPVHAGESAEALAQRVQAVERELLVRTLQNIACGNMRLTALATPPEPPCPMPHHRRKSQHP